MSKLNPNSEAVAGDRPAADGSAGWEYMVKGSAKAEFLKGFEQPGHLQYWLNNMDEHGWELVTCFQSTAMKTPEFVFRRKKQNDLTLAPKGPK